MQLRANSARRQLAKSLNCAARAIPTAALSTAALLAAACAPSVGPSVAADSADHQPFGGSRAAFGEAPGVAAVSQSVGRCQSVPALDRDPLLADFEQDSVFLRPVPERHGTWFMANDGSPEGKQEPEQMASARG